MSTETGYPKVRGSPAVRPAAQTSTARIEAYATGHSYRLLGSTRLVNARGSATRQGGTRGRTVWTAVAPGDSPHMDVGSPWALNSRGEGQDTRPHRPSIDLVFAARAGRGRTKGGTGNPARCLRMELAHRRSDLTAGLGGCSICEPCKAGHHMQRHFSRVKRPPAASCSIRGWERGGVKGQRKRGCVTQLICLTHK